MAAYRTNFGLGTANFTKYNQNGQSSNYPSGSTGWGVEIDLDVEMVSAVCPKCTIYLIEANGADTADLETAETEAVTLGAHIISNSWICYGSVSCVNARSSARRASSISPRRAITVTTTTALRKLWPASSPSAARCFRRAADTYSEAVWNSAGSGCATGVTKPAWQHDTWLHAPAPTPTSRLLLASAPNTTPTATAAGSPSAARASPRRSSAASSVSPATRAQHAAQKAVEL